MRLSTKIFFVYLAVLAAASFFLKGNYSRLIVFGGAILAVMVSLYFWWKQGEHFRAHIEKKKLWFVKIFFFFCFVELFFVTTVMIVSATVKLSADLSGIFLLLMFLTTALFLVSGGVYLAFYSLVGLFVSGKIERLEIYFFDRFAQGRLWKKDPYTKYTKQDHPVWFYVFNLTFLATGFVALFGGAAFLWLAIKLFFLWYA